MSLTAIFELAEHAHTIAHARIARWANNARLYDMQRGDKALQVKSIRLDRNARKGLSEPR